MIRNTSEIIKKIEIYLGGEVNQKVLFNIFVKMQNKSVG